VCVVFCVLCVCVLCVVCLVTKSKFIPRSVHPFVFPNFVFKLVIRSQRRLENALDASNVLAMQIRHEKYGSPKLNSFNCGDDVKASSKIIACAWKFVTSMIVLDSGNS